MPRIRCTLFGHHRDASRAYVLGNGWRAPCRACGERMARDPHGRWRIVPRDEAWPGFAPFAPAPRQPFESERGHDGDASLNDAARSAEQCNGEALAVGGADAGKRATRPQPEEGDRTRRLLRALFEQSPASEASLEQDRDRRVEAVARAPQAVGHRQPADGASEAQMFAIAFACCRDMLFRLSEQFARQTAAGSQPEDASPGPL